MSAIPYYFNLELARLAVGIGRALLRSRGHTEIVFQQKELDGRARAAGVTVIPTRIGARDGEHPGPVRDSRLDHVTSVKIFVGGLPQHPEPPLNYQIVYSLEGVLDYYTTFAWVLRDGKRHQVKALSEREPISFPAPVGTLEAFHTRRTLHVGLPL